MSSMVDIDESKEKEELEENIFAPDAPAVPNGTTSSHLNQKVC